MPPPPGNSLFSFPSLSCPLSRGASTPPRSLYPRLPLPEGRSLQPGPIRAWPKRTETSRVTCHDMPQPLPLSQQPPQAARPAEAPGNNPRFFFSFFLPENFLDLRNYSTTFAMPANFIRPVKHAKLRHALRDRVAWCMAWRCLNTLYDYPE